MADTVNLRTRDGMNEAIQYIYEQQSQGRIDPKTADALNTTVKTGIELNLKLPLKLLDVIVKAKMKKIDLPTGILPTWALPDSVVDAKE